MTDPDALTLGGLLGYLAFVAVLSLVIIGAGTLWEHLEHRARERAYWRRRAEQQNRHGPSGDTTAPPNAP